MSRKLNVLVAFVCALILCLGGITPVFATEPPAKGEIGTETNPARAAITKLLKTPVGTVIPAMNFIFTVSAIEVDGTANNGTNMPPVGNVTISYSGGETATPVSNIMTLQKESADIFAGIPWAHAGVYVYEVREDSAASYTAADPARETLTYSPGVYTVKVYVKDEGNGPFVYMIGALISTADNSGQNAGEKVDPTPGGDGTNYTYSQMIFTNSYVKTNGSGPNDPDNAPLIISKAVAGAFGGIDSAFNFSITVTAPSLVPGTPVFNAVWTDAAGSSHPAVPVTSGTPYSFQLKHGEYLSFIDTPVGTAYSVTEAAANTYTASARVVYNGSATAIPGPGIPNTELAIANQLVGETKNSADFTNTRDDITPTGLNLNDLPFIGLIILAVAGIAGYIVLKTRKAKKLQAK